MNMHNELELRKFVAPEFIFGIGAQHLVGRYAKNFGARKILVVTDPGIIAAGWVEQVTASIEDAGIPYTVFAEVTPNPRAQEVMNGAEIYQNDRCNVIVAVGGGSPMDCAKGIGIVSSNKKHIVEFEGVDQVPVPCPPLICIPTTSGSSADVSQFAIITDMQQMVKIAIVSKTLVPDIALIDPQTNVTMSSFLTASTGIDALTHAIEAFVSNAHSPVTDLHALEAIRLINANLLSTIKEPDNLELRGKMMLGSLHAGLAFSNAILGAVHAMTHSLGGLLNLSHGECCAVLLRHVTAYNFHVTAERYQLIGEAMGLNLRGMLFEEKKLAILDAIHCLQKALGFDRTLGQLGVHRSDIPVLAQKAMKDPCMATNPRRPKQKDIEALYEEAL